MGSKSNGLRIQWARNQSNGPPKPKLWLWQALRKQSQQPNALMPAVVLGSHNK